MVSRQEMILSESYGDFIIPYHPNFFTDYEKEGAQVLGRFYGMIHRPLPEDFAAYLDDFSYTATPKLFTLLDTVSLEASGIPKVQTQPNLQLKGKDILLGFIDTGIDYTHPAFRKSDGSSRITSIWDQSIQEGIPPASFDYGTEYTNDMLNLALANEEPSTVVPTTDENGHGTFLAGVAGGSLIPSENFSGAAPDSSLVIVKLKEAKKYLKDFFFATGEGPFYQETDLMLAILYLLQVSRTLQKNLVICISVGSNQGSHGGESPFSSTLNLDAYRGVYSIVAAGNEAGKGHHYYQVTTTNNTMQTVEILVAKNTKGFTMELWGQIPSIYTIGFETPLGEVVEKIAARADAKQEIKFVLERTEIFINYENTQTISGNQLIFMRLKNPTPGVWKLHVTCKTPLPGSYHIWLPMVNFSNPDIVFLMPNPDTTLTVPASSRQVITISTYNAYNNSLFLNSSRGYSRLGDIKPDIAAPGVDVYGPRSGGGYTRKTGSSIAAAITSGGAALLVEWGASRTPQQIFNSPELKALLIRGAHRSPDKLYPNREWGYGTLDIYQVFISFTSI